MADGMPLLRVRAVSKSFGAVAAVREVSFDLYGGEAHALVGENGAGKSTIVKMLAGVHRPDSGTIELNGVPTELHTPADAKAAGIAVIYQEPTLFPDLTVAENIAMGRQPLGRFKTIDRAAMVRQAAQLFTRLGVSTRTGRPAACRSPVRRGRSSRPGSSASTPSAPTARSCSARRPSSPRPTSTSSTSEGTVNRYCFCLQVKPDRLEEYVERHRNVWPEMQAALRETGWHNYSLFLRDDGLLIGYVEAEDLEAAQKAMAATEVNARWQAEMTEFFTGIEGRPPDESFLLLPEIFHLSALNSEGD